MRTFSTDIYRDNLTRIFIGGTGRSGTTIMKHGLMLHPEIYIVPREIRIHVASGGMLDFQDDLSIHWSRSRGNAAIWNFKEVCRVNKAPLPRPLKLVAKLLSWSPLPVHTGEGLDGVFGEEFAQLCDTFLEGFILDQHKGVGPHPDTPASPWTYETAPHPLDEVAARSGELIDELWAQIGAGDAWCEDTPINIHHISRIHMMFPRGKVKFIHMVRDPYDTAASLVNLKESWTPTTFDQALIYLASTTAGIENSLKEATCEVRHQRMEDYIAAPEETIKGILDFLGIDFHKEMRARLPNLPMHRHNIGRSRSDLSTEQRRQVWDRVGAFYGRFGYGPPD